MSVKLRRRRGRKVWVIDILYRSADGKRHRYRRDAQVQTRAAALSEERRLWEQFQQLGYIPTEEPSKSTANDTTKTFKELMTEWKAKAVLKRTTLDRYQRNLNAYVVPQIGDKPLGEIDFKKFLGELTASLRRGTRAAQTLNNVQVAVRSILKFGRSEGVVPEMVLPKLIKPKDKVIIPPTPDEVFKLIEAAPGPAKLPLSLAAYAGLRAGEIRGLRRMDVNLKANELVVRVTLYGKVEDVPKSGHQRQIPLPSVLREQLELALLRKGRPEDRVCLSSKGAPWTESGLRSAFKRAIALANVPNHRLHNLRHFFVTEAFEANIPANIVQALAGHQHLKVTQGYFVARDPAKKKAMADLGARLEMLRGNQVETGFTGASPQPSTNNEK